MTGFMTADCHDRLRDSLHGHLSLPLPRLGIMVAQLGCDRGLHQHVPLRVQTVPVVRGVNVLVHTAMQSYIHTYIHTYIHIARLSPSTATA